MSSAHALVIGSASSLPVDHFLPFFRSLRAVGYEGRTCLFLSRTQSIDRDALGSMVDEIIEVDELHPMVAPDWAIRTLAWSKRTRGFRKHYPALCRRVGRLVGAAPGNPAAEDLEFRLEGVQSLRYAHYFDYLCQHPEFESVMISDLRDVIFQRDPFDAPVASLEVFLEDPAMTFATAGFNQQWVADLYGADGAARLGNMVVSCSGVTFGTRDGMIAYLEAMAGEVERHLPPLGPHDQAIHNWLVYGERLDDPLVVRNGYGRVLTMGAKEQIDVSPGGVVLNDDGSVPAVLHQYDRHVALAHKLLATF
jgi:hypothetical protein